MKVAILAGGAGTRLVEETVEKPKALVEIGGHPILWHILMYYSHFGFNDFVIALGYKGTCIKRWVKEYCSSKRDMIVKMNNGEIIYRDRNVLDWPNWTINLVETGKDTATGGRIKRLAPWLDDQTFMLTWCDILANVNLNDLLNFHRSHERLATLTAVRPTPRFGHLTLKGNRVAQFKEKPKNIGGWVNGAFFVLEPEIFKYIDDDATQWEREPLEQLASEGQLMAYKHTGFWQCMDLLPEKILLGKYWESGKAPWKIWK